MTQLYLFVKQKQTQGHREYRLVVTKREGFGSGIGWEFG